ncbi:hypothetical protein [Streptomyces sp. cg36]|uniref:hypothetical protein n=1 Tax=Streptomyces sp. cg36 TaxID=3238798 RepID=UPI0034E23DCA
MLAALHETLDAADQAQGGALWRLAEEGRQLDANLVRLPAGTGVPEHVENALDVLLIVVEGEGHLGDGTERQPLAPGSVAWLPKAARRALHAGPHGLAYLSVHQRRPGLRIGPAPVEEGGEAPCALDRVCPDCGRLATERDARYCSRCGEELATA